LALAAARLKTAEELLKSTASPRPSALGPNAGEQTVVAALQASLGGKDYQIKSKIIILLTDGQNNAGKRSPLEAAQLARDWGIKIYAIGIGGRESFVTVQTPFGDYRVPGGPGADEATLKTIAEETGGAYWLAESGAKLQDIYQEIDKLERTEIESVRHIDYAERFAPFVLIAFALLLAEQILVGTVFRRIP
jgi:Ca-activated chloride channel homolog